MHTFRELPGVALAPQTGYIKTSTKEHLGTLSTSDLQIQKMPIGEAYNMPQEGQSTMQLNVATIV